MAKEHALPKGHFRMQRVNPEHLAFAFHVAQAVITQRMASDNPAKKKIILEDEGELTTYSLADTSYTRAMVAMTKELKSLYPGEDDASFQSRSAIMNRVDAVFEMLKLDEIDFYFTKDQNGDYFLGEEVVKLCATASLSSHKSKFKHKEFIKHLSIVEYPSKPSELRFHFPKELVNEEHLSKISEQSVR